MQTFLLSGKFLLFGQIIHNLPIDDMVRPDIRVTSMQYSFDEIRDLLKSRHAKIPVN
jgi:hypothetical protein